MTKEHPHDLLSAGVLESFPVLTDEIGSKWYRKRKPKLYAASLCAQWSSMSSVKKAYPSYRIR